MQNKRFSTLAIGIAILAAIIIGSLIYYAAKRKHDGTTVLQKEDIRAIHEREVQKAIRELNAEKLSKKKAEEQKAQLKIRKAELQSLDVQLRSVLVQKARALAELDDIRRPHLFRSHSKKERQVAEQLQTIENLEARAAALRTALTDCKAAIDTLSIAVTQQ